MVESKFIPKEVNGYPKLRRLQVRGSYDKIVLFTEPTKGTVVSSPGDPRIIGLFSDEWDSSLFEDFIGEVTLSN